ncbi:hypothetical protein EV144_101944 [Flavobacterium sp. 270]|uniref:hypothetical protein n=1 Tax=Flavobacterium sp. 270 TaxID=2512114 RepID=UPI001065FFC6|nr:hypothetical protein [Flavobacterium sp. 270]TDW52256.1 hypothetical protein EV144_101944 [Flavobacterium sp. 270]
MKGLLLIDNEKIGEVNLMVIDEPMGAIGGDFIPFESYQKYQIEIQKYYDKKGIANVHDFNFRIILSDNTELYPEGGIGVIDSRDFNDIYVESAGNSEDVILKIKNNT